MDLAEAHVCLRKAADQGFAKARFNLGALYMEGLGVSRDEAAAQELFSKAAASGDADSQFNLGVMHRAGLGVPTDPAAARGWFEKAAAQAASPDRARRDVPAREGGPRTGRAEPCSRPRQSRGMPGPVRPRPGEVFDSSSRPFRKAVSWFEKAAAGGVAEAMTAVGLAYYEGLAVKRDLKAARRWFRTAADHGQVQGLYNLATMHRDGEGIKEDLPMALRLYREAALAGDTDSQYQLGLMHFDGKGVVKDRVEAYVWIAMASEQGHSSARMLASDIVSEIGPAGVSEARDRSAALLKKR